MFPPRLRLGLLAAAMLVAAFFWDTKSSAGQGFQAALVRVGVLAAAGWFAWPTLAEIRWMPKTRAGRIGVMTMLAMTVARPYVFAPISLALLLLTMFRPSR